MGPEEADESLRKCLAKGADRAIRVWDDAIEGSDSDRHRARAGGRGQARGAATCCSPACNPPIIPSHPPASRPRRFLDWPHAAVVSALDLYTRRQHRRVPPRARGRAAA